MLLLEVLRRGGLFVLRDLFEFILVVFEFLGSLLVVPLLLLLCFFLLLFLFLQLLNFLPQQLCFFVLFFFHLLGFFGVLFLPELVKYAFLAVLFVVFLHDFLGCPLFPLFRGHLGLITGSLDFEGRVAVFILRLVLGVPQLSVDLNELTAEYLLLIQVGGIRKVHLLFVVVIKDSNLTCLE